MYKRYEDIFVHFNPENDTPDFVYPFKLKTSQY